MRVIINLYFIIFQLIIFIFNENLTPEEIIILSTTLWLSYVLFVLSKFNIKSPIFLFSMVFNICNVIHIYYLANPLNFEIIYTSTLGFSFSRSTFTLSLVINLLGVVSVLIGTIIGLKKISFSNKNNKLDIILENSNVVLFFGFIFYLFYIFSYGGIMEFYSNLYNIRNGMVEAQIPSLQLIGNFRYIFYLGVFIEIYKYRNHFESKKLYQIILLVLISFLIAFSSGGRFVISFIFFQLFLITYNVKKIQLSTVVLLSVFTLVVVFFFPIKWSFFKFLAGEYTFNELVDIYLVSSEDMYKELIGNHMGSFSAFIVLLENGRTYMNDLFFQPVLNLVSIIVPRRFLEGTIFEYQNVFGFYNEIINYERYLLGEFHFNFLGYFYIIFGYAGIVIFSMLLGFFLSYLEKKYIENESFNFIIYVYLFPSFIFMMAMNGSFDPYFRVLVYNFIGFWLLLFLINIKVKYFRRKT